MTIILLLGLIEINKQHSLKTMVTQNAAVVFSFEFFF